jgi:DNA-binding NtrC family response regulator
MRWRPESDLPLGGRRILICEDEYLIALDLEKAFAEAGAEVVLALTLTEAVKCVAEDGISAAVLDIRLGRLTTEPAADLLVGRNVPFIFYSGQAPPLAMRGKYPEVPVLAKPTSPHVVVETVARVANQVDG